MRAAAALLLLVGCAGCPGGHYDRKYPAPQGSALVTAIRARQAKTKSLRAKAVVDHMQGKQRIKGDVDILLARPASLHFRALDPSGAMASMLASDGTQFALLDAQNNRFLVGDATPCNLARLAQIAMDGASIIDLLTGGAPVPDGAASVTWDASQGAEVLTITLPAGRQVIRLDGRGDQPTWDVTSAEELDAQGKTVWRVHHYDFHDVGGVRLPAATKFEQPSRSSDVLVKFGKETANPDPPIPDQAWHLESDLPPEPVTCN